MTRGKGRYSQNIVGTLPYQNNFVSSHDPHPPSKEYAYIDSRYKGKLGESTGRNEI